MFDQSLWYQAHQGTTHLDHASQKVHLSSHGPNGLEEQEAFTNPNPWQDLLVAATTTLSLAKD